MRLRIGGSEQERGDPSERVGERTDERIDPPTPISTGSVPKPARARRRVERGPVRVGLPRGRAFERAEPELETPGHVLSMCARNCASTRSGSWPGARRRLSRADAATIWFDEPLIG